MATELGTKTKDLPHLEKMNEKGPFTDIDKFFTAVKNAQPGDLITLANNEYNVSNVPTFKERKGTAENPIYVRAQEPGKVILKGSSGYKFEDCTFFTWHGFHHAHKSDEGDDNISFKGGKNNRFAKCEVNLKEEVNTDEDTKEEIRKQISKRHWLRISECKAMRVDHCYFHHKNSEGQFCNVFFPREDPPRGGPNRPGEGPIFEYNYFQHQDFGKFEEWWPPKDGEPRKYGDAGGEAIQMGHSKHADQFYRAIVRYNCFEKCNGDGEIVTNKSCGNLYYNNTFTDCNGSLTLRHGNSTAVLGNYFKNCGLRVCGANNLIANNFFTENSRDGNRRPLIIHNGGGNYEHVVNNNIILNTFANGSGTANRIVVWGEGNKPNKPDKNNFKGNIITAKKGKLLDFVDGATPSGNEISNNIGWATGDAEKGDLSSEMATTDKDPLLTEDRDGIYRLQSGSPARNKIQGTPFKELTSVDIDGEERGPNTDAGCDQFSTESNKPKKRITSEDVGPDAKTDLGDSPDWEP